LGILGDRSAVLPLSLDVREDYYVVMAFRTQPEQREELERQDRLPA
jgi:hypothetical protein